MSNSRRALARPPTYVTKYFGCELGAQTQFDIKAERYIVNGCHDAGKMQDMLDGFIKKFVLCEKCENPETSFKILEKKGTIKSTCAACGHSFMIDMRHKLTTYIIKVQTSNKTSWKTYPQVVPWPEREDAVAVRCVNP